MIEYLQTKGAWVVNVCVVVPIVYTIVQTIYVVTSNENGILILDILENIFQNFSPNNPTFIIFWFHFPALGIFALKNKENANYAKYYILLIFITLVLGEIYDEPNYKSKYKIKEKTSSSQTLLPTTSNTQLKQEKKYGCLKGNCYDGQGTYKYNSGDIYKGSFKKEKKHGDGEYIFKNGQKYIGKFKDGKMHGSGIADYRGGSKYIGEYKNGVKHGYGKLITKYDPYINDTRTYIGEFKNDIPNGQGTLTGDNEKYVGEFKDGMMHGQGTYLYKDGSEYTGEFFEGLTVE